MIGAKNMRDAGINQKARNLVDELYIIEGEMMNEIADGKYWMTYSGANGDIIGETIKALQDAGYIVGSVIKTQENPSLYDIQIDWGAEA